MIQMSVNNVYVVLFVIGVCGKGNAESVPETADTLKLRGTTCYRNRDYSCAVDAFKQALVIQPSSQMQFNLASALDKAGRPVAAVRHYQLYLQEIGDKMPTAAKQHIARRLPELLAIIAYSVALQTAIGTWSDDPSLTSESIAEPEPPVAEPTRSSPVPAARRPEAQSKPDVTSTIHRRVEVDQGTMNIRRRKIIYAVGSGMVAVISTSAMAALYATSISQGDAAYAQYQDATTQTERQRYQDTIDFAQQKIVGAHVLLGISVLALGFSTYSLWSLPAVNRSARAPRIGFGASASSVGFSLSTGF